MTSNPRPTPSGGKASLASTSCSSRTGIRSSATRSKTSFPASAAPRWPPRSSSSTQGTRSPTMCACARARHKKIYRFSDFQRQSLSGPDILGQPPLRPPPGQLEPHLLGRADVAQSCLHPGCHEHDVPGEQRLELEPEDAAGPTAVPSDHGNGE